MDEKIKNSLLNVFKKIEVHARDELIFKSAKFGNISEYRVFRDIDNKINIVEVRTKKETEVLE